MKKKCVICKLDYVGFGNNAWPIKEGQCCEECNRIAVVPARITQLSDRAKKMSKRTLMAERAYLDWQEGR
jgi:hypothetical protein